MMKYLPLALALMVLTVSVRAGNAPLIRWEEKPPETEAVRTGKVVRLTDSEKESGDTFAMRSGKAGVYYMWTPSRDNSRATGGAALLDCRMSADGSALLFLEELGEVDGILGARIIVVNISGGRITAAPEFLKNRIVSIMPLKGSGAKVLALEVLKNGKSKLLLLDIASGKIMASSPAFSVRANSGMVWYGGRIALISGNGMEIMFFSPEKLGKGGEKFPVEEPVRLLIEGKEQLIMVSEGKVSYAVIEEERIKNEQEFMFPKKFSPSFGIISSGGEALLLGEPGGECRIIAGGAPRKILDGCGRAVAWINNADGFALNIMHNDMVELLVSPDFAPVGSKLDPGKMRPSTRGDVRWIFPTDKQSVSMLIADHRANVFVVEQRKGRTWRKNMIYQPLAE